MRTAFPRPNPKGGNTLLGVVFIGGLMCMTIAATLSLSSTSTRQSYRRVDWAAAFYHAENALIWAAQNSFEHAPAPGSTTLYSTINSTLPLAYMSAHTSPGFSNAWVQVVQPSTLVSNVIIITASAKVNNTVRTLQAEVTLRPPSTVFDYEYFLNNWGWWWGWSITGNGGQKSNWDFDFQQQPRVNGHVYAADWVEEDRVPYTNYVTQPPPTSGLAGADPVDYIHSGACRVDMPNLLNFTTYSNTALSSTTNYLQVGTNIIRGVLPGTGGLYVDGTTTPIVINGTVVVNGDVVIKGKITGQGTLYVGGDLYVAGDLQYLHGPDFSVNPETMFLSDPNGCLNWVNANKQADLVAYAVRGSIFGGDVTDPDWKTWCYDANYTSSGLSAVGDESHLGADGIAGTPDDNIPFLHADGTWSTWFDADGDGVCEGNYIYTNSLGVAYSPSVANTVVCLDSNRMSAILNYPTNADGSPVLFSHVASDNMGNIDGVFYTDHAVAMRMTAYNVNWHGTIVSRNEQIVFQDYLNFTYDSRINSRYQNNPNTIINLGLPWGKPIEFSTFTELVPDPSNL